jgi:3-hydroxyisobutyrate dehydrogenase
MSSIRVGFIGLGNIGLPIAKSLAKRGVPLTVYGRRQEVVEEMKALGAAVAGSPREMAAAADVVISVVRDIPETEEVIFGKNGVWEGIQEGATIVIASTVSPEYCRELYAKAKNKGVRVIDVGLSKSRPSNEEGEFTLMVGGDEDAVQRCRPVFEAIARHIFHLGGIGMGQTYKLVNQLALTSIGTITCECLNLGLKAGLDLQKMIDVMRVSTGNSWRLQNLDYTLKSQKLSAAAREPRRNTGAKDRALAMDLAEKVDANTPVLRFIDGLNMETAYDAYSARMKHFK